MSSERKVIASITQNVRLKKNTEQKKIKTMTVKINNLIEVLED